MSKRFLTIAAVVFALGLIAGAYLVLRTTVTSGELETSTPLSAGKTSDELLDELLKLNQQEAEAKDAYVPPEDKNLTEDFLKTIISESGGLSQDTARKVASSDFLASTILPYLKTNQPELFPLIPDSVLKIVPDSKNNLQKYFKDSDKDATAFFGAVRKMIKLDAEKINEPEILAPMEADVLLLGQNFENLSKINVPKKYVELHKNFLLSIFSLQKMMESILKSDEDPLKALIIFNDAESTGQFWKDTLSDYNNAYKSKK